MRDASPIGARDRTIGPSGDDFTVAMLTLGMIDQPHHAKRPVLHGTKAHLALPQERDHA
jgi:hypothetical protein